MNTKADKIDRKYPLTSLRDTFLNSDPGLLNLLLTCRGTLSVFVTAVLLVLIANRFGQPLPELAYGVVFSIVSIFNLNDTTRRSRLITLLLLVPTGLVTITVTSLIHAKPLLGEAIFLALVFLTTVLRPWHPRAMPLGMLAVVLTYVGLFLRLPPSTLPYQVTGLLTGAVIVWLVCFVLLPLRPEKTLRRAISSVLRKVSAALDAARRGSPTLPAELARLKRAALAAEDQLVLVDDRTRDDVRNHLFDLEQVLRQFVDHLSQTNGEIPDRRLQIRIRLAARRLSSGRLRRTDIRKSLDPLDQSLTDLATTAGYLQEAASQSQPMERAPARPLPSLAWRAAAQVTLASLVAIVGGTALSPQRWFWAVIAAYVMFVNTRSRGDTIYKGAHRVIGTLAGLFACYAIATLGGGDLLLESICMLLAVFGMYYLAAISYGASIFFVTVLLGLVYGAFGEPVESVLIVRLLETLLGVAAALTSAALFMPVRTSTQVQLAINAVLKALQDVVSASVEAIEKDRTDEIAAIRVLDRKLIDLQKALTPLLAGRRLQTRAKAERPVTAVAACVDAAHALAAAAPGMNQVERAELREDAKIVDQRLAALMGGPGTPTPGPLRQQAVTSSNPALVALARLDGSLALLAERLQSDEVLGLGRA